MKVSHEILARIHAFLETEIPECCSVECVVLCGSDATGHATYHSDIDLCIIGDFPDFRSETNIFRGR